MPLEASRTSRVPLAVKPEGSRDLDGKTAFVTGGASGIGLAMGRAFAEAGMRVMLADIEARPLEQTVAAFKGNLAQVRGVVCDVRD